MLVGAFLCAFASLLQGCKEPITGQKIPNRAPTASISLKEIKTADASNLVSTVRLFWTGADADGFIRGFQISIAGAPFSPLITTTDSLFRFQLTGGELQQNIAFLVRSVDDQGLIGIPDTLILPIRNSPPVASFPPSLQPRSDTALGALSVYFTVLDPDGPETLDSIYFRINGGPWLPLPASTTTLTLVPQNPGISGAQRASLYTGIGATPIATTLDGLIVEGNNRFEVYGQDLAGATSPIAQNIASRRGIWLSTQCRLPTGLGCCKLH
jgi:hypothetical protein